VKVLTVGNNTAATPLTIFGKLDLNSNGLVVDYGPGSDAAALTAVRNQVITGFNPSAPGAGDGNWQGNGITSSTAAANPAHGVGYALSGDVLGGAGNFMGTPVDASSVLARDTILGDANLDGAVGFPDLVRLAQNYNSTGANWAQGDFTYDGNVNFADLVKLAQNYNTSLPAALPGSPSADFQQDVAAAFAQVPEPAALLFAAFAIPLTTRRR
jgi:hypothetical protein